MASQNSANEAAAKAARLAAKSSKAAAAAAEERLGVANDRADKAEQQVATLQVGGQGVRSS